MLVKHDKEGYGWLTLKLLRLQKENIFFMADGDGTYDFEEIPNFIKELKNEYDLVFGNRFAGNIDEKAMPFYHKYIGNPILSFIVGLFFLTKIKDSHSGIRA